MEDIMEHAFYAHGDNISLLSDPSTFFEELLSLSRTSSRISLCSLYIGTGDLEKALLGAVEDRLQEGGNDTQVTIVLDRSRGLRKTAAGSSATMLKGLASKYTHNAHVSFFRMPQLGASSRQPGRLNEIIAVQHIKAYIFDDTVVLSGANLSDDYFTNRQDRYIVIRNEKPLAEWYHGLIHILHGYSDRLDSDGSVSSNPSYSPDTLKQALVAHYKTLHTLNRDIVKVKDTQILPTLQCKPLGIEYDESVTTSILDLWSQGKFGIGTMDLATGYLNLVPKYIDFILSTKGGSIARVIASSPKANGFHSATGIAACIPMVYSHIENKFYNLIKERRSPVCVYEYIRPSWTYHCKGMWIENNEWGANKQPACITLVGSPNFGQRSVHRDLESQLVVVTTNPRLKAALRNEVRGILRHCEKVDDATWKRADRLYTGFSWKKGIQLKLIARLIKPFL